MLKFVNVTPVTHNTIFKVLQKMNQFSEKTLEELIIIKRELDEAMIYALAASIGQKAILRKAD